MNIKEMSIESLKALAYDQLVNIQNSQTILSALNQEILDRKKNEEHRNRDNSNKVMN